MFMLHPRTTKKPLPASSSFKSSVYDSNGVLQREQKTFGKSSYVVPKLPPINASKTIKRVVLDNTIAAIREGGSRDDWANKTSFLESRFGIQTINQVTKSHLDPFDNYGHAMWSYESIRLLSAQFETVDMPGAGANMPNPARQQAWYLEMQVTCNPVAAFPECTTLPSRETQTTMIVLPRLGNLVRNQVNRQMINQPQLLLTYMVTNELPIQFLNRSSNGSTNSKVFSNWKRDLYDHARFETTAYLLVDEYVGEGVVDTPIKRLRDNKQVTRDPKSGLPTTMTVMEHYRAATNIISEMLNTPIEANLCEIVHSTLSQPVRDALDATDYEIPTSEGISNTGQLANLKILRNRAEKAEQSLKQTANIARQVQFSTTAKHRGAAFYNHPYLDLPARNAPPVFLNLPQPPAPSPTFLEGIPGFEAYPWLDESQFVDCTEPIACFLSAAEVALSESSGMKNPILCWGCGEPHRFNDCPLKDNPETRARAKLKIDEWRKMYVDKGYRNGNAFLPRQKVESDWKVLGFENRNMANKILKLLSTSTSAGERKDIIASLSGNKRSLLATPGDESAARQKGNPKDDTEDGDPVVFFLVPQVPQENDVKTVAMLAPPANTSTLRRFPLQMTQMLPTIQLKLLSGDSPNGFMLRGLTDTCAGVTLGYLPYHRKIYERFPQVVAKYTEFAPENYRDEYIGGVNGGSPSVTITACIEYILEYMVTGTHSTLRIALSKDMATNTIFGLTFQKKAGFAINLTNDTIHASRLGATFKIEYLTPPLEEEPPIQAVETGVSLLSLGSQQDSANRRK